ncbi:MAG: PA2169 family four-helix-bundle protein, partial [Planifilum fulgidum]
QLTQMELLQVQELLKVEELASRKYELYADQCKDDEMKRIFREASDLHRQHMDTLVQEMRRHSGRENMSH